MTISELEWMQREQRAMEALLRVLKKRKEADRIARMQNAAVDVCFGMALAIHVGCDPIGILETVKDDINHWADQVDWENYQ